MSKKQRSLRGRRIKQAELANIQQPVVAGQSRLGRLGLIFLFSILSVISGGIAGLLGGFINVHAIYPKTAELRLNALCIAIVIGVWLYATLQEGFAKGLRAAILATAAVVTSTMVVVSIGHLDPTVINATLFFIALSLTLTFLSFVAATLATSLVSVMFVQNQRMLKLGVTILIVGTSIGAAYSFIQSIGREVAAIPSEAVASGLSMAVGLACGGGMSLLAVHATRRTNNPLLLIRQWAIALSTWGSTSFCGLDLSEINLTGAQLANTDLRAKSLYRTCFKGVTGLSRAWVDNSYLDLANPKVQELLIQPASKVAQADIKDRNFSRLNLQGADLRDANLEEFDFTETNLNGADLRGANLRGAVLVKAQLLGADLSSACLTDACIQDWNINAKTCLAEVECDRVYIRQSPQGRFLEPKPDSGTFHAGEFEKWLGEIQDTIDLIFRNGLNWRAFAFSLTQTALNHEHLGLTVRSLENKGDGVVVAKLAVATEANKATIHQEIMSLYPEVVRAIEGKYELVLKAQQGEIERGERRFKEFNESQQQFIQGMTGSIAEPRGKVVIQGKGNRVYMIDHAGSIMENQNVNAGGDVDLSSGSRITIDGNVVGSNVTLADRNSQVTSSVQQLRDINTSDSDELAKILTTLQNAINIDTSLSDAQKKDALDAVETLAEEGKKPQEQRVTKLCSMALNALKGLSTTVVSASKLAEILKTCLPTLTAVLHL